jgi:origin recognition complex subunit 5
MPETLAAQPKAEDIPRIYKHFVLTVYDALVAPTSTSITTLSNVCARLWPRFIWPAISGEAPPGKASIWDFPRLLVRNRTLFHSEGEAALLDHLESTTSAPWTFDDLTRQAAQSRNSPEKQTPPATAAATAAAAAAPETNTVDQPQAPKAPAKPLLTQLPTLLLLSAYLCSHTPQKHDILLFSRLSNAGSKSRKIRYIKRGNPGTTPKKAMEDGRRKDKTKSLAPKAFSLERLLAVARAVSPEIIGGDVVGGKLKGKGRREGASVGWSDKAARTMAELERLRLVRREDEAMADEGGGGRWRVGVGREVVADLAVRWGLGVVEWEMDL